MNGRGSSDKRVEGKVSQWDWKKINKIKDDNLDINVQSKGYKKGKSTVRKTSEEEVTDSRAQESKMMLAMTFKTELRGIKYEEKITQIQTGGNQDLILAKEQRERGR